MIWYFNGRPVKESKDFQLLFEGDRCSLIIREVYLEDSGEYKCVAKNPQGFAESSCRLIVERKLKGNYLFEFDLNEVNQAGLGFK